jgi:hypothetical protein
MALEDALGLDVLTKIVNVQWEGGLAVEFGDKAQDAPGGEEPTE